MSEKDKIKLEDIDNIVSAEIPDKVKFPQAYETVTRLMAHGPCGPIRPEASCMKEKNGEKKCSKKYPKKFNNETSLPTDG